MPTPLVYILAASHSGSTLLTMLLNAHPDIATIGELGATGIQQPEGYRCSCGQWILECPFWQRLAREARARNVAFSINDFGTRFEMPGCRLGTRLLRPLHRGPLLECVRDAALTTLTGWRRRFRQVARNNAVLVDLIRDYYGAPLFLDKGNVGLRLKYLRRSGAFAVKVLRLIRDGRAVAATYTNENDLADASDPRLRGGGTGKNTRPGLSIAEGAYQWRRCNEEAEAVLATLPAADWIELHYEDLCTDPSATLERVCRFLDLDATRFVQPFRAAEHHVVGNGMRLDAQSTIRLDERWKTVLTDQDLATFDATAGAMNRRYGYA